MLAGTGGNFITDVFNPRSSLIYDMPDEVEATGLGQRRRRRRSGAGGESPKPTVKSLAPVAAPYGRVTSSLKSRTNSSAPGMLSRSRTVR